MAKLNLGFGSYDGELGSKNFDPIPNGIYDMVIDATGADEVQVGQDKGTEYIWIGFTVDGGEFDKRKMRDRFMIAGKGLFKLGNLLVAVGLLDKDNLSDLRIDTRELHGLPVKVRVGSKEFDGKTYNEAKEFLPADGADVSKPAKRKGKLDI